MGCMMGKLAGTLGVLTALALVCSSKAGAEVIFSFALDGPVVAAPSPFSPGGGPVPGVTASGSFTLQDALILAATTTAA
jgi:hypothetical protein